MIKSQPIAPPTSRKAATTAIAMPAAAPALSPWLEGSAVRLTPPTAGELATGVGRGVTVTVFVTPPVVKVETVGVSVVEVAPPAVLVACDGCVSYVSFHFSRAYRNDHLQNATRRRKNHTEDVVLESLEVVEELGGL